jgi:hypothetical protein
MPTQEQIKGFERDYTALFQQWERDSEAVGVGAAKLGIDEDLARRALWAAYKMQFEMLKVEWEIA